MSDTNKTWIVLAMGLLLLGAGAPVASAEDEAAAPEGPAPSGATECVVVDPYAPRADVYIDECTQ